MDWDDLRVLLALERGGSRLQAARLLRVDKSTVSRRIEALERALGVPLSERTGEGRIALTAAGRQVAAQAEAMEDRAEQIQRVARASQSGIQGRVRLTAVPLVANRLLLPQVPAFLRSHPEIGLDLIVEARDLSLTHRDADVALRLARPRDGGQDVISRRIGRLTYAAYAALEVPDPLPWLGYDRARQFLSHAAAISTAADQIGADQAALAVNDAETLFQAVLAGLGMSLFPRVVGDLHPGLRRVEVGFEPPVRDVWLLVHRDLRDLRRIQAVTEWLDTLFR